MIHDFQPNWVYHPSQTILKFLEGSNVDPSCLSGSFLKKLNNQQIDIDSDTATYLARLIGGSENFWLNIQNNYEKSIRRFQESNTDSNFEDYYTLVQEMKKRSWLPSSDYKYLDQLNLKSFFGISDLSPLNEESIYKNFLGSRYKRIGSYEFSTMNIAAFMRKAELEFKKQHIPNDFNKPLFLEKLQEIKTLSRKRGLRNFKKDLLEICIECGVAVVFLSTLDKCPIRGVSKFIEGKGMIVITNKYNQDHLFWQTFFHEAAHLILHQDQMTHYDFGEPKDNEQHDECEKEADDFMVSQLIYPFTLKDIEQKVDFKLVRRDKRSSFANLCRVANEVNLSPSLLIGVLKSSQKIDYRYFNDRHRPIFDNSSIPEVLS